MMETLHILLVGWLVFGAISLAVAHIIFKKIRLKVNSNLTITKNNESVLPLPTSTSSLQTLRANIIPSEIPQTKPPPSAMGSDSDAVRWINKCFEWLYGSSEGGLIISQAWNESLNDYTTSTALETGVLIEILEFLPQTQAPTLTNLTIDCLPKDDMIIACDIVQILYLHIQTTRTQRDITKESDYACEVDLQGKLKIEAKPHQCLASVKFNGEPKVKLVLEGVRNNSSGLDERQLQEVVKEELISALQKSCLYLDFVQCKMFPNFERERIIPNPVIPVGYDALLREKQTHPPSYIPPISRTKTPPPNEVSRNSKIKAVMEDSNSSILSNNNRRTTEAANVYINEKRLTHPHNDFTSFNSFSSDLLYEEDESPLNMRIDSFCEDSETVDDEDEEFYLVNTSQLLSYNEKPENFEINSKIPYDSLINNTLHSKEKLMMTSESKEDSDDEDEDSCHLEFLKADLDRRSLNGPPIPERFGPNASSNTTDDANLRESMSHYAPYNSHTSAGLSHTPQPVGIVGLNGKRLLVKVVKAANLGIEKEFSSCYVVVEMDEPAQRYLTAVSNDTLSPEWGEQFLFDLSDNTLELLFEVYDKTEDLFLGLGIIGIEELIGTSSQRQVISLQARPYENEDISGSLTCEFLFLDRADLPDLTLRRAPGTYSLNEQEKAWLSSSARNDSDSTGNEDVNENHSNHEDVQELQERKLNQISSPNIRSSMVIPSNKKGSIDEHIEFSDKDEQDFTDSLCVTDNFKPGVSATIFSTENIASERVNTFQKSSSISPSTFPRTSRSSLSKRQHKTSEVYQNIETEGFYFSEGRDCNSPMLTERGRSRDKEKKGFFGTLKRKFSRSKGRRSQSVEPTKIEQRSRRNVSFDRDPLAGRSVSTERSNQPLSKGYLTVPVFKRDSLQHSNTPSPGSNGSSLSGASAFSVTTYISEASLLIVESFENGVIKHYLIPISLQKNKKWRKKGTKLHVYNEHIFVAKHLPSSVMCQICHKNLGLRIGKQGYECRDCSLKCHKECHIKTDHICPNSSVNAMDLVIVKDETTSKRRRRLTS